MSSRISVGAAISSFLPKSISLQRPSPVRRTEATGLHSRVRAPRRLQIASTYAREPPSTLRERGRSATWSRPWLRQKRSSVATGNCSICPVGQDQIQHVEMTQDMAGSFHAAFGKETFRLAKKLVDEMVLVDTDEICAAIKDTYEDTRTVVEPSGALALACARPEAACCSPRRPASWAPRSCCWRRLPSRS